MKPLHKLPLALALLLLIAVTSPSVPEPLLPPVDQRKACLECHDDIQQSMNKTHRHTPLSSGRCSECHNPHASRHADLLADDEKDLCAKCHTDVAQWSSQENLHDPFSAGRCTRCHEPHGANNAALLLNSQQELCATCHIYVRDWQKRASVHDPVKKGNCDACHDPHSSGQDNLLRKDEGTLCLGCHSITPQFTAKHRGFDPKDATCSACHDPHAGDGPGLIMKNKHAPFAEGDCNACHVATTVGLPLRGTNNQVCKDCHDEQVADVKKYSAHGATEEKSCGLCHKPHAAHEKNLLAQGQAQLCTKCHDPARGVKSEGDNPHLKFSCDMCHAPHGSAQQAYLKQPDLDLCANCHSKEHHVAHPMGENIIDPISDQPVTCLSCHDLHAWKGEPLLPAASTRDLCVRCHRDK